jgi:GNAT superfamily N-acetyltransferase
VSVRPARPGDALEIERVRAASWQAVYGSVLPRKTFDNWDYDKFVARREQSIRSTNPYAVVDSPIRADQLAGFINFGPSRDEDLDGWAEVFAFYARPDHWSMGVGRRLMTHALDRLAADGYTQVALWVLQDNPRGRNFYAKAGFVADGTLKDAQLPGGIALPELRLRRAIAAG